MGKGAAKKASAVEEQAANRYAAMAEAMNAEATPLRKMASDYYTGIYKGGPELQRAVAPSVAATKEAYRAANESIERNVAPGGALTKATRQLAASEASDVGKLYTGKVDEAVQALANLGVFSTNAGLNATGGQVNAGQVLAQLSASQAAAWGGGIGGLFGGLGIFAGMRK